MVATRAGNGRLLRATHALIDSTRSPVKVRCLEVKTGWLLSIISLSILIRGTDSIPSLWLLLHEMSCLDLGKATSELSVCDHIEASVNFLSHSHMRYFLE